jgi:protein TonB
MSKVKHSVLKTLSLCIILSSFAGMRATTAEGTEYDARPTPVKTPPPEYPTSMKQKGVSGLVALRVDIDETGAVTGCTVSKSSNAEFEQPAINAVKNWKFKPAQKGGAAVKISLILPIKFSVEE